MCAVYMLLAFCVSRMDTPRSIMLSLTNLCYFSLCILLQNVDGQPSDWLCDQIKALSMNMYWVILMSSGGHFAGAVFDG